MAVMTVVAQAPQAQRKRHEVCIADDVGTTVWLPWAPEGSSVEGRTDKWDRVERTARQPLVRYNSAGLRTLAFDVLLAFKDESPVDHHIERIGALGKGPRLITITGLSEAEDGPWRLEAAPVRIEQRTPDNKGVLRASVSFTFVQAVDVTLTPQRNLPVNTGPLTGGVVKAPEKPPAATARKHTVVKGETLTSIAIKYYGKPTWQKIADASKLRNPNLIVPGQVLTVPA